jgi:superfamily II DNA or RNA helicase
MTDKPHIELIAPETVAVSFAFDRGIVDAIKRLASRRWNPRSKRWEIHLAHLPDLIKLFNLNQADLPANLLEHYREGWAGTDVRVELTPLRGRLDGGNLPLAELDAAASFFVPGYKFSPRFRSKQWDGRKHLFSMRSLTFPAGLWPRLRTILERHSLRLQIDGEETPARRRRKAVADEHRLGARAPSTPLRDYQRKAFLQAMHAGRGVLQMPTGGGKTLLAAHLLHAVDRPAFFFVHTRDLLHQTIAVFERELGVEVGVLGDGRAELRPLTVATIQTAYRAVEDLPPPRIPRKGKKTDDEEADPHEPPLKLDEATRQQIIQALTAAHLVIFDECHHLPADSFYSIAMQAKAAVWRFGLSATPWRDDRQDLLLEAALGPAVSVTNFSDLIRLGYLVAPRIRLAAPRPPRIAGPGRLAYPDLYAHAIVENQDRNRAIATQARDWAAEGLSVLILVAQMAHGAALQELLPEAVFVHGALDSRFRRQALDDLERKLRPILIATTLADEGLDVPTLDAVILAGGGKSASRTYQRIGRALRPAEGKTEARILDFIDDLPYLREHSEARIELYRQEGCFQIEQDATGTPPPKPAPLRRRPRPGSDCK